MRPLAVLALLVLLSSAVQLWCIARAAVPAQDAVRYVAIAQSIERHGFVATWREHAEHPLYPALIYAMHGAWQSIAPTSCSWCGAAQGTSALLLILTVVPVYGLLRRMVDPAEAAAGAVFFCLLPEVARLGADGLSDSTHLFFVSVALWAIARHWRTEPAAAESSSTLGGDRAVWLLLSGAALGLAILARPEPVVAAASLIGALMIFQFQPSRRRTWLTWLCSVGCLAGGLLIVTPYLVIATSGRLSDMPGRVLGRDTPTTSTLALTDVAAPAVATTWRFDDGQAMAFGAKDSSVSSRFRGYRSALAEFARELSSAFQYWVGAVAVVGMIALARRPQRRFDRFAQGLFVLHCLAAIFLAARLGYLSTRHLMTPVLLGLAPAGCGAGAIGSWLADRLRSKSPWCTGIKGLPAYATAMVVLLVTAACLPKTLSALHGSRLGHRLAGDWLATDATPGLVLDTRGWTGLYSGRETLRYDMAKVAYRRSDLAYVVVEQRELSLDSLRGRTLRHLLASAAEPAASFEAATGKPADTVLVYRWRAERFTEALRTGQHKL